MYRITVDFSKDPPEIIKVYLETKRIENYQVDDKLPPIDLPEGWEAHPITYDITEEKSNTERINNCKHCNGTGIGLGWDTNNKAIEIQRGCKKCGGEIEITNELTLDLINQTIEKIKKNY